MNSATGLVNTLINVYTARQGSWSVPAAITAAVTGSFTTITAILLLVYDTWLLGKIRQEHDKAVERERNREAVVIRNDSETLCIRKS